MSFLSKNLERKSLLFILLPLGIFFFASIFFIHKYLFHQELTHEKKLIHEETNFTATIIQDAINEFLIDVGFLGNLPTVNGLTRTIYSGQKEDQVTNHDIDTLYREVVDVFVAKIGASDVYSQVRYIGENGNEVIRVSKDSTGNISVTPPDQLQYKGDRPYFQDLRNLPKGQAYISPVELNREGAPPRIEIPFVPVLRVGIPLYVDNEFAGAVIFNAYFERVIEGHVLVEEVLQNLFVMQKDGSYVLHKDREKLWGGPADLNTGQNALQDYAGLQEAISGRSYVFNIDNTFLEVQPVYWGSEKETPILFVVGSKSEDELYAAFSRDITGILGWGVGSLGLLMVLIFLLFRFNLRPIQLLIDGISQFAAGNMRIRIPEKDGTEDIRFAARTFNLMAQRIANVQQEQQVEISKKTESLKKELGETERLKTAMLNMLEDVASSEKLIKNQKAKLEIQKQRMDLSLQAGRIGTWEWNLETEELHWDEMMYRLYGKREDGFTPSYESYIQLVHSEDKKKVEQTIQKAIAKNGLIDIQHRIVLAPGEEATVRLLGRSIVNSETEKATRVIGVSWDISKEAEVDRAKSEFVSLASHQLRTPLSTINWYTEMLLDEDAGELNEEQKKYLEEIYTGNKRMVELVNALLNVSRLELGTFMVIPEPVQLRDAVEEVLHDVRFRAEEKQQELRVEYDKDIPVIPLDPKLIRMTIENIITNAIKYTPEKGVIIVRLKNDTTGEGGWITFSVKDYGYGIPKKQQDKIFSKLFRADNVVERDTEGTGLGLYIVKSIIDNMKGKIWFESEEGKGTTFYIQIPLSGMKAKKGTKSLS